MNTLTISGSLRANVGTKEAKDLRSRKLIPCVLYGGKEQIHFSAHELQFKNLIYTPDAHTVTLDIEGKQYKAILKDSQYDKITDTLIHADFLEIIPGKPVIMNIPVKTKGSAEGVKAGGRLLLKKRYLKVKAQEEKLPDLIEINVEPLQIGQSVRVVDIKIDGVQMLDAPNNTIVAVRVTRQVVEEPVPGVTAPAPGQAAPAPGTAPAAEKAAAGDKAAAAAPAKGGAPAKAEGKK